MSVLIHYTDCPVCNSTNIKEVLMVKDNTVSKELFPVIECMNCSLRFTQNIPDSNSIAPFYKAENYISHTNTSKGIVNRLYHYVRKKTLVRKRKMIEQSTDTRNGRLLDVGSGVGSFVNEMKQQGWHATGLEPDADARQIAKQQYQLDLEAIDAFYQLPADSFDAITLWHVLEHVHDLPIYIQQLKKLLKKNGKIFIAVPNYTAYDATVYKEHWAAYDVPRHLYHFSPRSMGVLMEKNGLKVKQHKPMWYDSFYISLLSSKYKNGNTNWIGAFFTGLFSNAMAFTDVRKCSSVIYIIEK